MKKKHGKRLEGTAFNIRYSWFHWFKTWANLHNLKVNGEALSADMVAVQEFPETIWETIDEGTYLFKQVFNVAKQNCTGKECQTKVTSVMRKVDASF